MGTLHLCDNIGGNGVSQNKKKKTAQARRGKKSALSWQPKIEKKSGLLACMIIAGVLLVLGVLNVDEETIMEDFMLTNVLFEEEISQMRNQYSAYIKDEAMLDELMVMGRGVYAPYMRNAIDYIKENYGDIPGYVKAELGLTDADIAKLQALYTQ